MRDNLSFYEREENSPTHSQYDGHGKRVSVVGIPMELGSDEKGLADAPRYLLKRGLERVIERCGAEISERTMVPCRTPERIVSAGSTKYLDEIIAASRVSSAVVERAVRRGDFALALGGDHSMALGTIAGAAAALPGKRLGVIWIDAHPDANTHETTISGNIHGMPAAAAMGFGHPLLARIGGITRKVPPENFLYIGLKDMDAAEIDFLRREKVRTITMLDIAEHGLSRAMRAIDALRRQSDAMWVSMDMDSIDKEYAPGVGMQNEGGLTRREVLALAQYIGKVCTLVGLDVVEISSAKDKDGRTATLAFELVSRFLGGEWNWYTEYMDDYRKTNVAESARRDTALIPRSMGAVSKRRWMKGA